MNHHPHPKKLVPFNPEITAYFIAAGFEIPQMAPLPNGLMFIKGNTAVQFWNDKIQVNVNNGLRWELKKSFIGFDRQNLNHLMMLMHVMDVITIQDMKSMARAEEESEKNLEQIINRPDFVSKNYWETA